MTTTEQGFYHISYKIKIRNNYYFSLETKFNQLKMNLHTFQEFVSTLDIGLRVRPVDGDQYYGQLNIINYFKSD